MTKENTVEQADREAAASGYFAWISGNPVIPAKMRRGDADDHSIVQAFARHRTQAAEAERARVVAWIDAIAGNFIATDNAPDAVQFIRDHLDGGMG